MVAAAQPRIVDGDLLGNAASHVTSIVQAKARLVVFPELSLTGYAADALPIDLDGAVIGELFRGCAAVDSIALVGAPIQGSGRRFIAMVRIDGARATVVYRKTFLSTDESRYFDAGGGPGVIAVDGWRVGMAICRDTGTEVHIQGTAAMNVDVYVCGVVHHERELSEQRRRGRSIALACRAPVVMSSFAGATGGGYVRTAGCSAIWSAEGRTLAQADASPGGLARATLRRPPV
ncbi:nitrilase-related carbon-nitrogen hydrolase [Mycobacterium sp. SMC-4]|uniref:carbon-nitrogen hydrolase family protein n=1 Tax=Mycobacterium sp. SMC-4 TaxID=2857059 RepID=UPI0028C471AF|nr:nitrilase-related carbon-nitrogen hydrolase [Mycobacterium sp. SMC-4]